MATTATIAAADAAAEPTLAEQAAAWMAWDPNDATVAALQRLVDARDAHALRAALGRRIAFGTAGLRGAMGCGPARMNDLTVVQTTQARANGWRW